MHMHIIFIQDSFKGVKILQWVKRIEVSQVLYSERISRAVDKQVSEISAITQYRHPNRLYNRVQSKELEQKELKWAWERSS